MYGKNKISYIPVNGHQVVLRELILAKEASDKTKIENRMSYS